MSEITPAVIAKHGISDEEYTKILEIPRRAYTKSDRIGYFLGHVVRALLIQILKEWLKTLPTEGPSESLRARRERWVIDIVMAGCYL